MEQWHKMCDCQGKGLAHYALWSSELVLYHDVHDFSVAFQNGAKIKKFSDYNYFRTHPFTFYNEVNELISGSTAKGMFSVSSVADNVPQVISQVGGDEEDNTGNSEVSSNVFQDGSSDIFSPQEASSGISVMIFFVALVSVFMS